MQVPIYALDNDEPDIHELAFVHPEAVVIGRVTIGPETSRHHRTGLRRIG